MSNLIGKRGLKLDQKNEIEAVLEQVNGRASRWTADYDGIRGMTKIAGAQLEDAGLPSSYRAGATAECFTSAPWSTSYRNAVKGNRILLRRFGKEWRVTAIETVYLYPKDSRANRVRVSLTADQAERIKAAAIAPFGIQPEAKEDLPLAA